MSDPLHIDPLGPGAWSADVPPDLGQGRTLFGGHVAGLALRAAETLTDRPLRSLAAEFVGPLHPGRVEVSAEVRRSGRALTQVEARVSQGSELALVALLALGSGRPTRLGEPLPLAPALPDPGTAIALPYLEGITPVFTQHYDYRWLRGGFPFSGHATSGFGGLIRPRDRRPIDAACILALLDGWPCPVLPRAKGLVPASTVTWLATLVREVPRAPTDAWWRFETEVVASVDGYVDIDSKLYAPDGGLIATSRQLVVEFSG